ncbi:MAG: hypothetical protein IJ463_03330 [Bacilli bacterium]|nr:hypothetical protein [Bacilli bacterium]
MDETIGVKGGHNDRRRTIVITKRNKKKLEEYEEERYIRDLEKKVKRQQKISLIKTLPIAIVGKTFVTLYDVQNGPRVDKEEEYSKLGVEEYDGDFTTKPIGGFNTPDRRDDIPRERRVIIDKTTGKKVVVYVPIKENKRNLLEDILFPEVKEDTTTLEEGVVSKKSNKVLEDLKARKIIDEYERQLKDIRYELRMLVSEYNVLSDEADKAVLKKDAEELLEKLSVVIDRIEVLKQKIKIDDLDKYDDNYIYTLVEGYLSEFKDNNVISEIKDSPLYVMISRKLDELDTKKDDLDRRVSKKKDELAIREERFEELKKRYYNIDRINNELLEFQNSQDMLLKELREKVANAMTVTDKVKVEFEFMNRQSRGLRNILMFGLLFPGPGVAKGMAAGTAAYLHFMNNIMRPRTVTKNYKVVTVTDYSSEIKSSMAAIDDASRLLNKTCNQIDKMIEQIETEFKDYLEVVPECKETLKDLVKIQSQLREKEYEMEKTKEQQKKVLENNNAKVLKRGEYAA